MGIRPLASSGSVAGRARAEDDYLAGSRPRLRTPRRGSRPPAASHLRGAQERARQVEARPGGVARGAPPGSRPRGLRLATGRHGRNRSGAAVGVGQRTISPPARSRTSRWNLWASVDEYHGFVFPSSRNSSCSRASSTNPGSESACSISVSSVRSSSRWFALFTYQVPSLTSCRRVFRFLPAPGRLPPRPICSFDSRLLLPGDWAGGRRPCH
jgi:hypothetical protein